MPLHEWIQLAFIAAGMGTSILLAIDQWVHKRTSNEADLIKRLGLVEFDIGRQKERASEKANEMQKWVGNVDIALAEIRRDIKHLEDGSDSNHKLRR